MKYFARMHSLVEAAERAAVPCVNPENARLHREHYNGAGKKHERGTERDMNTAELAEFWATGWPEGVDRLRAAMGEVTVPAIASIRRRPKWSDAGDELNRERLYAGDIERAWRTTSRVSVATPVTARILVDVAARWDVGSDELFWRGAAAASLAEALAAGGYSVEILATSATKEISSDNSASMFTATTVKSPEAPMNMNSLAAACCTASFFRGCLWPIRIATLNERCKESLGSTMPISQSTDELAEMGLAKDATTRTFIVNQDVLDVAAARLWVADVVVALQKETAFA